MNEIAHQLNESKREALGALQIVMVPLMRIFLRFGLTLADVQEVARNAAIEVAKEDGAIDGKPPTQSRIALLTGLTRPEVAKRIRKRQQPAVSDSAQDLILKAWNSDERWTDANGAPLELPLIGIRSFQALCKAHTTSFTYQTILDEFIRCGSVELDDNQVVRFVAAGFVPVDIVRRLQAGLHSTRRLLETVYHNVCGLLHTDEHPPRYQQSYWSNHIPRESIGPLREKLQSLLRDMRRAGAEEIDTAEEPPSPVERDTAGIGLFYFEEPQETKQ